MTWVQDMIKKEIENNPNLKDFIEKEMKKTAEEVRVSIKSNK